MKQKDYLLIGIVIVFSTIVSYLITSQFIGGPGKKSDSAEVVHKLTADFKLPDKRYFNQNSINPTRLITIDKSANPNPFNSSSN